ncbi:hypothetical protein BT63DRAFT_481994 [Microthyrium microscopicum]|uniref:Uncharacterized protein n=1 Tax=Microthyrium microscopicum TaxID=703497 RepID=A0A6A6U4I7_9PEZI|nr:hypothetical protein BT63DRAFT_481994 [Microthyrium microscopicum]
MGACTIGHYPVLNDVAKWHYKFRNWIFRLLPRRAQRPSRQLYSADVATSCPVYLTPLNGRTAGNTELLLLKLGLTVFLTIIPTLINFLVLVLLHGREQSWLFYLMCHIDVFVNVIVVHIFSNNPADKATKRNENLLTIRTSSRDQSLRSPHSQHFNSPRHQHFNSPRSPHFSGQTYNSPSAGAGHYPERIDAIIEDARESHETPSHLTDDIPLTALTQQQRRYSDQLKRNSRRSSLLRSLEKNQQSRRESVMQQFIREKREEREKSEESDNPSSVINARSGNSLIEEARPTANSKRLSSATTSSDLTFANNSFAPMMIEPFDCEAYGPSSV